MRLLFVGISEHPPFEFNWYPFTHEVQAVAEVQVLHGDWHVRQYGLEESL